MSIALSEFWSRLVRGGIVDAAGCKRLANAFADATGTPASDAATLAEFLVEVNELTEFQARCLTASAAVDFRHGDYVQRTDAVTIPLSHWLPVRRLADRRDGFLIRVGPNQFTQSRRQWLDAHAAVDLPSLQPFELQGDIASGIEVFSAVPEGRCLSEITAKKMKVERSQALTVGVAVADALAAMHDRSLVHGAVRADRVWLAANGQTLLLRDPSGPAAAPRDDQSAAWIDVIESPAAYAAPEFVDPSFAPNTLTDIYSLGCLLFRMVAGRLPFAGQTIEAEIAAHASEVPPELSAAIQQGEAGDPVLRVIAYVMAKSPAARFATARQVSDALKAVLAMTNDAAASKSKVRAATPPALRSEIEQPPATPPATQPPATPPAATPPAAAPPAATVPSPAVTAPSAEAPPVASAKVQPPQVEARKSPAETPPKSPSPPQAKAKRPETNSTTAQQPASSTPQPPRAAAAANATVMDSPATRAVAEPPPVSQPTGSTPPSRPEPPQPPPPAGRAEPKEPAQTKEPPQPNEPALPEPEPETLAAFAAAETLVRDEASDEGSRVRRRRKRKKNNLPFVFGILAVPVLLFIIMLIVQGMGGDKPGGGGTAAVPNPERVSAVGQARKTVDPPQTPTDQTPTDQTPTDQPTVPPATTGFQLVDDDRLLWVPPYAADSPVASLELLPPGPAVVVSARLARLLQDPIGREMIDGLSPELMGLIELAAQRAGVPAESIARCTVALHAGGEGWPTASLAIELLEPLPLKTLTDRWQVSASRTPDGATVYAGDEPDGDVYFLGDSEQGAVAPDASVKRFAVGPLEQIREVAANEGGEIPLPRLTAKVWGESSAESDLVALITPNFLFADGREMLLSTAPELVAPLRSVLIPDVAALLVSVTSVQQDIYAELRAVPSGNLSEPVLLRKIGEAFQSWPSWADTFIVDSVPDASWRLLATRMPLMLRFLVDHTRFGVSDGTIVANVYLPGSAASQITLSTLLAMNTAPGGPAVSVAAPTKPLTVDEMLNRKMSIAFDQESLEFAINVIVDQFKVDLPEGSTMPPVRIVGGDLEKSGITQNQQIRDFKKKDLPLRTVLTDLLLGANPDKTATGPADPKQSLVWVLREDAGVPGGTEILITTRAASEGVHQLPAEFVAKPE